MRLTELKEIIDNALESGTREDYEVMIAVRGESLGPSPAVIVGGANCGIDWDSSRFFLFPEQSLIKDNDEAAHWDKWRSKAINLLFSLGRDDGNAYQERAKKLFGERIPPITQTDKK